MLQQARISGSEGYAAESCVFFAGLAIRLWSSMKASLFVCSVAKAVNTQSSKVVVSDSAGLFPSESCVKPLRVLLRGKGGQPRKCQPR